MHLEGPAGLHLRAGPVEVPGGCVLAWRDLESLTLRTPRMTHRSLSSRTPAAAAFRLTAASAACAAVAVGLLAAAPAWGDGTRNVLRERVLEHRAAMAARHGLPASSATAGVAPDVVGGNPAAPGRWPYMVALVNASTASNLAAQFCGASLVGERHVLTAAHCVSGSSPGSMRVLVGTQDLNSGGRRVAVEAITVHPQYRPFSSDRDVAVLRLAEAVTEIAPVAFLTSTAQERAVAPAGTPTWGIGWGETFSNPSSPPLLQEVEVPLVSRRSCNAPASYDGSITRFMLCAGEPAGGQDTCFGDSGGPLLVRGTSGAPDVQVGITSWGDGCALPDKPGVYARLGTLGAWVQQQISAP
jgi:secreted trypsin-like serine protease